jgi:hypothetical protein
VLLLHTALVILFLSYALSAAAAAGVHEIDYDALEACERGAATLLPLSDEYIGHIRRPLPLERSTLWIAEDARASGWSVTPCAGPASGGCPALYLDRRSQALCQTRAPCSEEKAALCARGGRARGPAYAHTHSNYTMAPTFKLTS